MRKVGPEDLYQSKVTSSLACIQVGQITEHTTVTWPIAWVSTSQKSVTHTQWDLYSKGVCMQQNLGVFKT